MINHQLILSQRISLNDSSCFILFVRLSFSYWLWRRVHPISTNGAQRVWPVSRVYLLLRGTWSYLCICRWSVLPYTGHCICFLNYDYVLHVNFANCYCLTYFLSLRWFDQILIYQAVLYWFSSLVVVLSLSIREVVSSSHARAGRVKPKTFKICSNCSFAKSTAFRSENHGSFRWNDKNNEQYSIS
jgi:hypothetical protein